MGSLYSSYLAEFYLFECRFYRSGAGGDRRDGIGNRECCDRNGQYLSPVVRGGKQSGVWISSVERL